MAHRKQLRLRNIVTWGLIGGLTLGLVIQSQRLALVQQTLRDTQRQVARTKSAGFEPEKLESADDSTARQSPFEARIRSIEENQAVDRRQRALSPAAAPTILRMEESSYLRFPIQVERAMMGGAQIHMRSTRTESTLDRAPVSPTPQLFEPFQPSDNHQP